MVTIIIPVYELDSQRKRNLEFIYDRLVSKEFELIIGVQAESLDDYYKKFEKAKVLNFFKSGARFNKSFIINSCIKQINSGFAVFLDADIYFDFASLNGLSNEDEIVKPFDECVYLSEEMTQEFIETRTTQAGPDLKRISALGGGSLAIRADLIKSHNLFFDENFSGWGWEDIDFGDLIRSKGLKIRTINQPAAHLYHKPSLNIVKNSDYFIKKNRNRSKLIHIFNCCSEDCRSLLESKIKHRSSEILLVNCCDVDHLNNDNLKFIFSPKEKFGFNLEHMVHSCFLYLEDDGWVVYTGLSEVDIDYNKILQSDKDYLEIKNDNCICGFAIKKRKWQEKNLPKIYIDSSNYLKLVSELFR